ncbi:TPA: helix-turn-helix domain-containing protein [Enterobacter soli]|jgi:hypothetical protein|uniref:helix-turn-helix domain-containing protein n=1 Tax=Enterobacter soli TaxID=885040 RepID=UPI002147CB46|nr:helix-turn-helix domain-containing protein [Enterobacter soli]MCR1320140.1 helix-turn-helix domain-containing protein [Enterobacter soli]MDD9244449.1 helix-turn-helix domain-containing protein [Enterobacter soli]
MTSRKPKDYIISLIESVSEISAIRYCNARTKVSTHSPDAIPQTLILHKGSAELYRAKDHLLIRNIHAPAILGLNFIFDDVPKIYMMANTESQYEVVHRSRFEESVRKNNLWEALAYLQMHNTHLLSDVYFSLVGMSSYEILCNCLMDLMNEPEFIRESVSASDYIQRKSSLSRSGVMKILGDLRSGGYIELERGKLKKILNLPKAY